MKTKIKGFTFKNNSTPEAIERAKGWLTDPETWKKISKTNYTQYHSLGNFLIVDDDGKDAFEEVNWACHANLNNTNKKASCVALYSFTEAHENWKRFFKYLTEESFAADFILAVTERGFVVSSDIPGGLLHAIAMMSRSPRQFREEYFLRFNQLLDAGIPGDIAYLCTFCINGYTPSEPVVPSVDHRPWTLPNISGMKMFLSGEFSCSSLTTFRETSSQYCSGFLPSGDYSYDLNRNRFFFDELLPDENFFTAFSEYKKSKVAKEGYKPPNPFSKIPPLKEGDVTLQELDEFILPYCMKEGVFDA